MSARKHAIPKLFSSDPDIQFILEEIREIDSKIDSIIEKTNENDKEIRSDLSDLKVQLAAVDVDDIKEALKWIHFSKTLNNFIIPAIIVLAFGFILLGVWQFANQSTPKIPTNPIGDGIHQFMIPPRNEIEEIFTFDEYERT